MYLLETENVLTITGIYICQSLSKLDSDVRASDQLMDGTQACINEGGWITDGRTDGWMDSFLAADYFLSSFKKSYKKSHSSCLTDEFLGDFFSLF